MAWALRIGGFRTRSGPRTIRLVINGEPLSIYIPERADSNDIVTLISEALQARYGCVPVITVDTPATASMNGSLALTVSNFEGATPVVAFNQDGTEPYLVSTTSTSPLELAQVDGIFAARGRLGAWDKDNAIYWSSYNDPIDFEPSLATQANVLTADAVKGKIIKVSSYPEGFIVHSTGNTVIASYTGDQFVFKLEFLSDKGIIDPRHVTHSSTNPFGWDRDGLYQIDVEAKKLQQLAPELTDELNKLTTPLNIRVIGDRYLCINITESIPGFSESYRRTKGWDDMQSGRAPLNNLPGTVNIPNVPLNAKQDAYYTKCWIYDLDLQRWGNATLAYSNLFSLSPINQPSYNTWKQLSLANGSDELTGIAAILQGRQAVVFTPNNPFSYIILGKYQLSRRKQTKITQVYTEYEEIPNCTVTVEHAGQDGRLDFTRDIVSDTVNTISHDLLLTSSANWFNIKVKGKFRLIYTLVRGYLNGSK